MNRIFTNNNRDSNNAAKKPQISAKEPYISAKKPCVYATYFCKKNMYRCINGISTHPSQFLPCAALTTTIVHAYRQYVSQILEHKSPVFLKKKALCIWNCHIAQSTSKPHMCVYTYLYTRTNV